MTAVVLAVPAPPPTLMFPETLIVPALATIVEAASRANVKSFATFNVSLLPMAYVRVVFELPLPPP